MYDVKESTCVCARRATQLDAAPWGQARGCEDPVARLKHDGARLHAVRQRDPVQVMTKNGILLCERKFRVVQQAPLILAAPAPRTNAKVYVFYHLWNRASCELTLRAMEAEISVHAWFQG